MVALNVPYFGDESIPLFPGNTDDGPVLERAVPVKRIKTAEGEALVTTVFDLFGAFLGIDRGIGGQVAKGEMDNVPFTPRWQQDITGVRAEDVIRLSREFATAASTTKGRACVLMGAGLNQWYQTDNAYRGIMNILMLCRNGRCSWRRLVPLRRAGEDPPRSRMGRILIRTGLGPCLTPDERNKLLL